MPALMSWLQALAESSNWPAPLTFALELCVEEAVANTIMHGSPTGAPEVIVSVREADDATVEVRIEDDGSPFDPTVAPPPREATSLEEVGIGGLGVHLMRKFSKSMAYARADGRNRLTLIFARTDAAPA
jgi:anti-sigma regulatory factor (Ser/Thr protein kinase)